MLGSDEARILDDVVLRIAASLDPRDTLQAVVDAAFSVGGGTSAALYLRAEDGAFHAMSAAGVPLERLQRVVLTPSDGLLARLHELKGPAQVTDFQQEIGHTTAEARAEVTRTGVHATLGVPLISDDQVVGALYVGRVGADSFDPATIHTMERLAAFAGVALQNAQRYSVAEAERMRLQADLLEQERSRSQLLAQLLDLASFLNSDLSVSKLQERVVDAALELVGAQAGTMGVLEGDVLVFRRYRDTRGWHDIDVQSQRGEGISGHVWDRVAPYITNHYAADPHAIRDIHERFELHRIAAVPMVDRDGRLVGTLEVHDPVEDRDFEQGDVEALQMLAHQAAIAIENARLSETKDEFLSIVSHELKTPITTIKGFAQVLERRLSPESRERVGKYVATINAQSDRLTGLINDLLDLSRIQTGRFSFEVRRLDYSQLVHEVAAQMRLTLPEGRLQVDVPDGISIEANADRIEQVLINLVDNAATHGPDSGVVSVTVRVEGDEVITDVTDQGSGLPAGEEERIFRPYYQVRHRAGEYVKGLGLGLFISRQVVEQHGGRIWAEPGAPMTFRFALPIARPG